MAQANPSMPQKRNGFSPVAKKLCIPHPEKPKAKITEQVIKIIWNPLSDMACPLRQVKITRVKKSHHRDKENKSKNENKINQFSFRDKMHKKARYQGRFNSRHKKRDKNG